LGRWLWAGFGGLGALLLGAALLLPLALTAATALGKRLSQGVISQWFWADTRQQVPGLSLALMALLLALAANIGVGTMVSSFRLTFTGWLDQRLASELYVSGRTEEEAARMAAWLAPRTEAVLPIWSAEEPILGRPGEIYGVADHATYRDNWPLIAALPDAWDRVARGEAVLVNEQLYRREGLALGAPIDLPGGPLTIAGVYSDYGNPRPQVLMSPDTLTARFPEVPRLRFGIRIAPAKADALARALVDEFGLPESAIIDQASIKRLSLEIFERTFTVTAALNVLTLGVAGLAMFASLLTLSGMRLPQLAPVWAMGLTRARLAQLDFLRTLMLAALTFVAAVPLGLVLAWVLLAVINVVAFGWRLPMHVFPLDWLRLGLLALLAAALAGLIPVLRLARMSPATLVRIFSNER
jgi:putative ABC transport system permease protein